MEIEGVPEKAKGDIDTILPDIGLEVEHHLVYKWHIESWNALKTQKKAYSPDFVCGGAKWRVLLFPNGNQQGDTISIFLDSIDAGNVPKNTNWHVCAHFALALVNVEDENVLKFSSAQHRYNPNETDWGFNHLVKLNQLFTPIEGNTRPLIENDQAVIKVYIKIMKDVTGVLWHNFVNYDSKKETGFVGLKNQGATCYMNSLLQSLYFTPFFRKATYAIPTEKDEPTKSIALALQRVFYQLQHSDAPVGTTELTKSFGWDTLDSFMQHDVQEFNRVLQDNLESKMKGTKAEGAISKLFVGKYKSYIKCMNVNYESSRVEDFYDIQLNVKGCKNLYESFVNYIAVETLDGDNKYQAEGYGLQDAKKGVIFTSFPPVLHLQLKRFEYDIERDTMVKINDRHEFPTEIELSKFLDESVQAGSQKYHLHGVLVHSGDLHGGHYCAFLRPEKNGKWFKFDDDRVVPVTEKEVMEDNYGGEFPANPNAKMGFRNTKRFTNAYMLVYVRESDIDNILAPLEETDIPDHLRSRLEEERVVTEQRRKEKEEQHLYLNVKVLLDEHIREHPGFDLCNFDDKAYPITPIPSYKVKKEDTLQSFKLTLGEKLGVPPERIRLWTMVGRQNKTIRPDSPVPDTENEKTMEAVKDRYIKAAPELRFYAEIIDGNFSKQTPEELAGQIVIFLKYYDPVISKIEISFTTSLIDADFLLERLLKLFEEIKPGMVEVLKPKLSFHTAELGDGDIICFPEGFEPSGPVVFKPKPKESDVKRPDVELVLSKKMVYETVVQKLGERLGSDWRKIRLSTNSVASSKQMIKPSPTLTLQEMLQTGYYSPMLAPSVLFYEELEVNVSELEFKRFLKVAFIDHNFKEVGPLELLVLKTARASEVVDLLKERIKTSRMYEFFADDDLISTIGDFSTLYVEETPMEELNTFKEGDKMVHLVHFNKEPARGHGVPFKFVLRQGEMFSATKERIRARMAMNEKDFAKAKFYIVVGGFGRPKPVEDGDILTDYDFLPNDSLGMDHIDRSGKSNRPGGVEKAIKIFVSFFAQSYSIIDALILLFFPPELSLQIFFGLRPCGFFL
ncbi:cysteine proteinase [Chytridium lagenaria]|nr:cysteine proteinase [Chytridium lagenaria]